MLNRKTLTCGSGTLASLLPVPLPCGIGSLFAVPDMLSTSSVSQQSAAPEQSLYLQAQLTAARDALTSAIPAGIMARFNKNGATPLPSPPLITVLSFEAGNLKWKEDFNSCDPPSLPPHPRQPTRSASICARASLYLYPVSATPTYLLCMSTFVLLTPDLSCFIPPPRLPLPRHGCTHGRHGYTRMTITIRVAVGAVVREFHESLKGWRFVR